MQDSSVTSIVGRGSAWLAGTTLFLKGIGVVSVFIILNHLTRYEYGFAELVISVVPLLSLFLLPGLNATVIADMGRERGGGNTARVKGMLLSYLRLQYLCAVVVWALVFFGSSVLARWYGHTDAVLLFQVISFSFLVSPLRTTAQTFQSVYFQFRQQSVQSMLEEVWKLATLLLVFYVFHLTTLGLIVAVVLCQVLALISIAVPLLRIDASLWATPAVRYPTLHFLRYHGKWGIFSTYIGTVNKNIRLWIVKVFLGTEAVALFAVVQGLIGHTVSLIPLDTIMKPLFPQYLEVKERFYRIIAKAVKYEVLGYLVAGLAAAICAPFLILWFFPQYVPAVPLFQVMLCILLSVAIDVIFAGVFYALQAQQNLFWASAYKLALTLLCMPPFLHYFGLFGIAYSNILVNYLYVWERYLMLKRLLPGFSLKWRNIFTVDDLDRALLSSIRGYLVRRLAYLLPRGRA